MFSLLTLQSTLNLYKNSQAVKKVCGSKMLGWKRCEIKGSGQENGCDNSLMAKTLIAAIQMNLCVLLQVSLGLGTKFTRIVIIKIWGGHTNSPELSLLKFLPLNYYHSHFLATTFDFKSFFTLEFWGRTLFS